MHVRSTNTSAEHSLKADITMLTVGSRGKQLGTRKVAGKRNSNLTDKKMNVGDN